MLDFTVVLHILPSHSISPNKVSQGCDSLSQAVQAWAWMNCHLLPYHHYSQHFENQYLHLGPAPGWWAWGYEWNNGTLSRTTRNNCKGGELKAMMMQKWWKVVFIQNLVSYLTIHSHLVDHIYLTSGQITHLEALPHSLENENSIDLLKSNIKGGTKQCHSPLQDHLAAMDTHSNPNECTTILTCFCIVY